MGFTTYGFLFSEVGGSSTEGAAARSESPGPALQSPPQEEAERPPDPELEKRLLGYLSDLSLSLPTDSLAITDELNTVSVYPCDQDLMFAKNKIVSRVQIHVYLSWVFVI